MLPRNSKHQAGRRSGKAVKASLRPRKRDIRLGLESLEQRTLLTSTVPVSVSSALVTGVAGDILNRILTATSAGPPNGWLSAAAEFAIAIRGGVPVSVGVAPNPVNSSLDELVGEINDALALTSIGGEVVARLVNGRINFGKQNPNS